MFHGCNAYEIACDAHAYILTRSGMTLNCSVTPADARECVFSKNDDGLVCKASVADRPSKTKTG